MAIVALNIGFATGPSNYVPIWIRYQLLQKIAPVYPGSAGNKCGFCYVLTDSLVYLLLHLRLCDLANSSYFE